MTLSIRDEKLMRNAPKSQENLIEFLVEGLGWPLPEGFEPEDVSPIQWSLEDLHLDQESVAKLSAISQLPRFVADQQFGVFILKFEGGKLPIGAVRRVVNQLIKKKRVQAHVGHEQWSLDDLLFFCQANEETSVLHVVAFREKDGVPVLKAISWSSDSTDNRLELVARNNLPGLTWNTGDGITSDSIRESIRQAFTSNYREGVKTSAALAAEMALVAKNVRQEISALLDVETENGPLQKLHRELKSQLISNLTQEDFADLYAQTMVYGLLTKRITHPEEFSSSGVSSIYSFDNPFLDSLYSGFRSHTTDEIDIDDFGLEELAILLAESDVNELLADFGNSDRADDPVVYFYERFLQDYDPKKRKDLGTYYTPLPVVRTMVRAVDYLIKTELKLPKGVADSTNWGTYSKDRNILVPENIQLEDPVIRVLDPATGTGTFLLEWLREAFSNLGSTASNNDDVIVDIVNRMDAFEINLSSYSVAHLKSTLELPESLRSSTHFNIRLTDTLAGPSGALLVEDNPISQEGVRAEESKFHKTHSVVIGNPPWDRDSGGGSAASRRGGMVRHGLPGTEPLLNSFFEGMTSKERGDHALNLYNLYVYFWRWSTWKLLDQQNGPAVIALVTPSAFLSGPGFKGMRAYLQKSLDKIWIINLGGDGYGDSDENVFEGVRTPCCILIGVRSSEIKSPQNPEAFLNYFKVEGTRSQKLDSLNELNFEDIDSLNSKWNISEVKDGQSFVQQSNAQNQNWIPLEDIFSFSGRGIQFSRTWPVGENKAVLERRWNRLLGSSIELKAALLKESRDAKINVSYPSFLKEGTRLSRLDSLVEAKDYPDGYLPVSFRSFDTRICIADRRVIDMPRPKLWQIYSEDQIYFTCLPGEIGKPGPSLVANKYVPDLNAFNGRGGVIFPIMESGVSNLSSEILTQINEEYKDKISWQSLIAYIFALLGTSAYSETVSELGILGRLSVPITKDKELFAEISNFGAYLLAKLDFTKIYPDQYSDQYFERIPKAEIMIEISPESSVYPENFSFDSINETVIVGSGSVKGISQEVWDFEVAGLKPLQSWLASRMKNRSGKSSSVLDEIRPESWDFSNELIQVISHIQLLLSAKQTAKKYLDLVIESELIELA